jgi:parallel beta-helix repeat protein
MGLELYRSASRRVSKRAGATFVKTNGKCRMRILCIILPALLVVESLHAQAVTAAEIGARKVSATPLAKGTIFISPNGSGTGRSKSNPCNLDSLDLYKGRLKVRAGDVVFFRGGVYEFSMSGVRRVYLRGGTASSPVIYESYHGETAIFDGSSISRDDTSEEGWREGRLQLRGEYAILRKVEVRNMPQYGVRIFGNHNTVEGCRLHHNKLSGLGIANLVDGYSTKDTGGSYNVVRDNVIYSNSDVGLVHHNYGDGDNADGITIHSGVNNLISHNTVYDNSDDGIDTWKSMNSTVEYNLVYGHGKGPRGNGNGIKLGGASTESPLGANARVMHNISHSNKRIGINVNGGKNLLIEYNTVFGNGDFGYAVMKDTVLIRNISLQNKSGHVGWSKGKTQTDNSWQKSGSIKVISTDPASGSFLKPLPSGGFESMGAHAVRGRGKKSNKGCSCR